ncbi:TPA: sugar phosphate isomerase/epimerase [Candidatus Poribacteria bacterium]|nr:sugar phosphate isomerase/epimerase [Candidatus Poribacteria bacterium]
MSKPVLGAQLYTVRKFAETASDLATTLKKIADIGYTAVQISGIGRIDPKDVARMMEDAGLTVAATHVSWNRLLNDLDAVIEEHKLWKCAHVAIGGLPKEYYSIDGIKRFIDELTPIAERLLREGMDFSYHNHNHELAKYEGKTWLERLYEQADPRYLKAELDTYWIQAGGGDPAEWVRKCAGREPLLHLKDMIVTPDRQQRFAEIGEGNLNWPAILQAAKEGGVEWYLVEQDNCYERDPFESLAISYRNLREMGLR